MAFLDDLNRKLTMISQEAANQTKIFAESARINVRISDEEKQVNTYLLELGKKYFEANKSNPNAEHLDLINNIKDGLQRINLYKEEIRRAKGVKACPQCGSDIPMNAMFCNYCGAKVPPSDLVTNCFKCPQCGSDVPEGSSFCTKCGCGVQNASAASCGTEGLGTSVGQSGSYSTPGFNAVDATTQNIGIDSSEQNQSNTTINLDKKDL